MMKAIVNTAPNQLTLLDYPLPEPGPGQVRIRTASCGICATDLELIAGWERTGFPTVPGHEWAGYVDKTVPGVESRPVGQPCVADNVLADGSEVGLSIRAATASSFSPKRATCIFSRLTFQ